jgi:hypothetical protein
MNKYQVTFTTADGKTVFGATVFGFNLSGAIILAETSAITAKVMLTDVTKVTVEEVEKV